ncbi:MAG: Maf family nucleotide pyrophosphatase [Aureispira sp.]
MAIKLPFVLLASKSPRRRQLLEAMGCSFKIVAQDIEESFPENIPKSEVPVYLAKQKAAAVREHLQPDTIILAADTIVLQDDTIFHKPKDYEDALRILRALSGRQHKVITGVCLLGEDKQISFSDTAYVHFAPISEEEMNYYITTYQPYDKAGAYAIQEWIGLAKVIKIEGIYNTIVGLPTQKVYEALREITSSI